jgi:hypothetical protein
MIDGIFTLDDDDKKKKFYKMLKIFYHVFKFNWRIITHFEEKNPMIIFWSFDFSLDM